jgi:hypothetical protein
VPQPDQSTTQGGLALSTASGNVSVSLQQAGTSAQHVSLHAQHHALQAEQTSVAASRTAQQAAVASVTALHETNVLKQEAAQVLYGMRTGMQELHDRQGQAHSIATSSEQRSAAALQMVEELKRAREHDQLEFQGRMNTMEKMMEQQVNVSNSAINAIQALKAELSESRSLSHRLQEALSVSQAQLASLTVQQQGVQQAQLQSTAESTRREQQIIQQAEEVTRRLEQLQQSGGRDMSGGMTVVNPAVSSAGPSCTAPVPTRSADRGISSGAQTSMSFSPDFSSPLPSPNVPVSRQMSAGSHDSGWIFGNPLPAAPPAHTSLFNVSIKPREPPTFSGERGQDITTWLHQVDDYLEFVQPGERQAVAYIILLLHGNARTWWEAEYLARGRNRPNTVAELKMLLRSAFESPVREQRARSELLNLHQKSGENASTYMSRTRALLHKVPGYDEKTALQQWILGLRQPYRLEAAKAYPRTLTDAERLVARLEDATEFAKGGRDDGQKGKQPRGGEQQQQQQQQQPQYQQRKKKQPGQWQEPQKWQNPGYVVQGYRPQPQPSQGPQFRGTGRGGPPPPSPHRAQQVTFHPAAKQHDGPGGRGRGRGRHQRPRVAFVQTPYDDSEGMADDECPEPSQQLGVTEPVFFRGQSSEN